MARTSSQPSESHPSPSTPKSEDTASVFLYVPNIIGYVRVLLVFVACSMALGKWTVSMLIAYCCSQLLDAVDGYTARKYNQVSQFGALLDQVTDRLSTTLLYLLNAAAYPNYVAMIFIACVADLGGHWLHVSSALVAQLPSYKTAPDSRPLLKFYYHFPGVIFVTHAGYEIFWLSLYVCSSADVAHWILPIGSCLFYGSIPLMLFKLYTNVEQAVAGAQLLAAQTCPAAAAVTKTPDTGRRKGTSKTKQAYG